MMLCGIIAAKEVLQVFMIRGRLDSEILDATEMPKDGSGPRPHPIGIRLHTCPSSQPWRATCCIN